MREPGDEELGQRFRELKSHDRRGAPAFGAVVESARARAPRPRRRQMLLAAAALLIVIAGGATAALLVHRRLARPEMVALGSWQSPTAFLLRMPGTMLDSVPALSASVINLEALTSRTPSRSP